MKAQRGGEDAFTVSRIVLHCLCKNYLGGCDPASAVWFYANGRDTPYKLKCDANARIKVA